MKPSLARVAVSLALVLAAYGCQGADRLAAGAATGGGSAAPAAAPLAAGSAAPAAPPAAAAPAAAGAAAPGAAVTKEYAADIEKLCDVVQLSGSQDLPQGDRMMAVATWLAANLTTPESRQFLARIQPLVGEEKASALEAEAIRTGVGGCNLAAEWR